MTLLLSSVLLEVSQVNLSPNIVPKEAGAITLVETVAAFLVWSPDVMTGRLFSSRSQSM